MRNNVFGAVALASAVLVSSVAVAGDRGPSFEEREKAQQSAFQHSVSFGYQGSKASSSSSSFRVVYLNELPKGEGTRIKSAATPAALEAIRGSIDANTAAELGQRGVNINNVVGASQAFNGKTVYYVR